jgi:hypothetical protein
MRKASSQIEKGQSAELPQPGPGAERAGPLSPVALELPPELRQRIQAAVNSELAQAAGDDQETTPEAQVTGLFGWDRLPQFITGKEAGLEECGVLATAQEKPRRLARARLIELGVTLIVIAILTLIVIGSLAGVEADDYPASPAIARAQAAAWIAEQVSPDVTVSCDAVMCAALHARGFPVSKLLVLGPASPDPAPSVLVIETAAVRELFGSSLAVAWAPAVLASFGSGTNAITVRVVAPHGAAAYQAALNADLANRKTSGAALLHDSRVAMSATAKSQLLAGRVDMRLLLALASVAKHEPIDIVRFGNLGPGASPGVPLNFVDLAESVPAAHMVPTAYAPAVWALLDGGDPQIRPERAISGPIHGQAILRVEFASPGSLGNLGSGS